MLTWWRCYGCGRKVPEAQAEAVRSGLRGLDGQDLTEHYHKACLPEAELRRRARYRDLLKQQRANDLRWHKLVAEAAHSEPLLEEYQRRLAQFHQTYGD